MSQVVGQRVLARSSGQLLGSVRRLVLEPARSVIVGAHLERAEGGDALLDWSSVVSVGPDALMVDSADAVRRPETDDDRRLMSGELDLPGKLVMTEGGDSVGELEDLEFEERSGRVSRLHVPGHALPARFLSLGRDVVIIATMNGASSATSAR